MSTGHTSSADAITIDDSEVVADGGDQSDSGLILISSAPRLTSPPPNRMNVGGFAIQMEVGAADVESAGEVAAKKFDDKRVFRCLSMVLDFDK